MKYEEAISTLRDFLNCIVPEPENIKTTLGYRRFEAFNRAIEALEKQIPKKPIIRKAEDYFGNVKHTLCPNCQETEFVFTQPCFCHHCGQAIDWEVSE